MRRFNYTSYLAPNDPKRQRKELYGKFRTAAASPHDVAKEFLATLHDAVLLNVEGRIDSEVLSKNKLRLTYSFESPFSGTALVEMQEVEEAATHPLTQEGFIAWAEDRVEAEPVVDGKPNSVELELAGVLHERLVERLYEEKARDLQAWLSDILWSGHRGYSEMPREELLNQLQIEFIEDAEESFDTVEDALE
ncbi:hypothetical protein [Lacipirellula parvula]|uniref:Uncharacterized protein n=1 Tax=Lacipirellula parvula TaxID=2650471 RepID=A0A5K7X3K4_9BACT|nr:hypothetical protein [Lacipirellula parvula]BBO31100.1 hypothetical protein PLANPX_0712 [Lacipirellula parvula]